MTVTEATGTPATSPASGSGAGSENESQPNPVADNANATVQPITDKPSQAEGEDDPAVDPGAHMDSPVDSDDSTGADD